jgi:hypothetical protein
MTVGDSLVERSVVILGFEVGKPLRSLTDSRMTALRKWHDSRAEDGGRISYGGPWWVRFLIGIEASSFRKRCWAAGERLMLYSTKQRVEPVRAERKVSTEVVLAAQLLRGVGNIMIVFVPNVSLVATTL